MTLIVKKLADGSEAEFDSEKYSPEVIDRYVAKFNADHKGPSPVPSGDTSEVSQPNLPNIDPSELEGPGTWLDKNTRMTL